MFEPHGTVGFCGDVLPQARDICSYLLHIPPKKTGKVVGKSMGLKSATTSVGRICVDFFRLQEGIRGFGGVPHTPVWRDAFTFGGMQKVAVSKQTCAA